MGNVLMLDQYREVYAQRRMYTHAMSNFYSALSPFVLPYSIAFLWLTTFVVYEASLAVQRGSFYRSTLESGC
jgi:hypothetical protein